ncbi:MAG: Gfo/Idh/MocA family oxidoreductase [Planctomycetia bacterium]|nr:Gfo/Idh/MocA family oxidoreductase [Planctomycetia bacterium]
MSTKVDRRSFIKTSAAVGTAALAGRSALGESAPTVSTGTVRRGANDEIRMAILGIRAQGRNHIGYQSSGKNIRIVTLCDVDENLFADRVKLVPGGEPKTETDLRRVLDDKNVDCVVIAMPNHWHALATVWACQAGKDVYVEKPATYCISEGKKVIEAARKYDRVVQAGTHLRAQKARQDGIKLLREGILGDLYMARAFIYNSRDSIGRQEDCPVPAGVDYDRWLGPAPARPFNPNRFHYNWHWNWDYGNGEIGNNGPHMTDLVIQGLDKQDVLPVKIASQGGRYVWNDQGETANTQATTYQYEDGTLVALDIRNLPSNQEADATEAAIFYGAKGYMVISLTGGFQTVIDGKPGPKGTGGGAHRELAQNFQDVVRSRNKADLLAPIAYGHTGAALCHLGNIAYRLGRSVQFDPTSATFPDDAEANALLTRTYRKPYAMPEQV